MYQWALQDAKAKLSELIKQANQRGPQLITVRGEPTAVVLSQTDYQQLTEQKPDFISLIKQSPLQGLELEFKRDRSPIRDVSL